MKQEKYEELGSKTLYDGNSKQGEIVELLPNTTHVKVNMDYSGCYYGYDRPDCVITFYKKV